MGKPKSSIKQIMGDLSRYSVYKHQFEKGNFYFINNNVKDENIVIKFTNKTLTSKVDYYFNLHKLPKFSERHANEDIFLTQKS